MQITDGHVYKIFGPSETNSNLSYRKHPKTRANIFKNAF